MKIIFIHGFGGWPKDWSDIGAQLKRRGLGDIDALSLPGHGVAPGCEDLHLNSAKDWALWQAFQLRNEQNLVLVGYSMGARLATLLAAQLGVKALALLSGGLGISDERARAERRLLDQKRAQQLVRNPGAFWSEWYLQEMFAEFCRTPAWRQTIAQKTAHRPGALSEALQNLGVASHDDLRPLLKSTGNGQKIGSLLYIAGELDKKYCDFAAELRQLNPQARVEIVPGAGHMLPLEAPQDCAKILAQWLQDLTKGQCDGN